MADNKSKTDRWDRSKVSGSEPYEVSYFAKKHGLAAEQAREIIEKHAPSREACDAAAERKRLSKVSDQQGGDDEKSPADATAALFDWRFTASRSVSSSAIAPYAGRRRADPN